MALAVKAAEYGIRVNCCDPGVVNSGMITMHRWYDPLADIFSVRLFAQHATEPCLPSAPSSPLFPAASSPSAAFTGDE